MKAIYDSIENRILIETNITDVRRFNNQPLMVESGADILYLPSALVEITDVEYNHRERTKAYGICNITVHIVEEVYNGEDVSFDLSEAVDTALNRYSDGVNYHPLELIGVTPDDNFTNLHVIKLNYRCAFVDYISPNESNQQQVQLGLNITLK
jgi:hypothetical protein